MQGGGVGHNNRRVQAVQQVLMSRHPPLSALADPASACPLGLCPADSIETVMGAQWYDANISLPGCDKNMPGTVMAMARLNRPSLMIYGGACGR